MSLPPTNHPRWSEVLLDKKPIDLKFLGARLTMGRLKAAVASNPASMPAALAELRDFFAKLEHLPTVQADLKTIFG